MPKTHQDFGIRCLKFRMSWALKVCTLILMKFGPMCATLHLGVRLFCDSLFGWHQYYVGAAKETAECSNGIFDETAYATNCDRFDHLVWNLVWLPSFDCFTTEGKKLSDFWKVPIQPFQFCRIRRKLPLSKHKSGLDCLTLAKSHHSQIRKLQRSRWLTIWL